jgi:hypothetical protein
MRSERVLRSANEDNPAPTEDRESDSSNDQPLLMRRNTRHSVAKLQDKAHLNEVQDTQSPLSDSAKRRPLGVRETKRKQTISRELDILRKTAGADGPSQSVYNDARSDYNSDSDDVPLANRRHNVWNGRKVEHIQGMCDVVSITIDNLRPTETQFVEADFLDSEPEGDEDWDGSEDLIGDGRYAW